MARTKSLKKAKVKIAILKRAKAMLMNISVNSSLGICYCIRESSYGWEEVAERSELLSYVSGSLRYNVYLGDWMRGNKLPADLKSVRKARLAWIDWMIESLRATGLEGKN